MDIKVIVRSMRLRTVPLSLSGVVLGTMLATADFRVDPLVAVFIFLTTASLQILSNFSNDLGDLQSGTDTMDRRGPHGALIEGTLSVADMKKLIAGALIACIVFGLLMIRLSFGSFFCMGALCLMLLGAAAIVAAMRYTLGSNPYGYRGLGDIYVFIFFGLVSVLGSYFVAAHDVPSLFLLLPAAAIGCFSVGVLNINNIRDIKTDALTRMTVAMKMGAKRAKIYQTVLIVLGWVMMTAYCCFFRMFDPWHFLFVLTLPLYVRHLIGLWKNDDRALDPYLPLLVIATFLFALLAGFGFDLYLLFQ